jgi:death-on-curing family protein
MKKSSEILIYKNEDNKNEIEIQLKDETIWLDAHQLAAIFGVDRTVIVKHIQNIYKTGELKENSTCAKIAQVAADGKMRKMNIYNLDVAISTGYRTNSAKATQFRIWATSILKDHLVKGFTLNQKRLDETGLKEFEEAVGLVKKVIQSKRLESSEAQGLLEIITSYSQSWLLLQKYDEAQIEAPKKSKKSSKILKYDFALRAIEELKSELLRKKEASDLFGRERQKSLEGIFGSIYQTFSGSELYPTVEEKAANLLYFIIKDHPFSDGNKRIAAFLFIVFLAKNKYLLRKNGEKKINDNTLVAVALLIAESDPKQKDLLVKLVMNFLNEK